MIYPRGFTSSFCMESRAKKAWDLLRVPMDFFRLLGQNLGGVEEEQKLLRLEIIVYSAVAW